MALTDADLKPCPFCGGAATWCGHMDPADIHDCHQITCLTCGQFDLAPKSGDGSLDEYRAAAALIWNARP